MPEAAPVVSAGKHPIQREPPARGFIRGQRLRTLTATQLPNSPGQTPLPLLTPSTHGFGGTGGGKLSPMGTQPDPLAPAAVPKLQLRKAQSISGKKKKNQVQAILSHLLSSPCKPP